MKKFLVLLILFFTGISFASAETLENQRYVVSNKKDGKARFVPVERADENWKFIKGASDVYFENGVEFEGFEVNPDKSLSYAGTPYVCRRSLIAEYEGKYYVVPTPEKNIKPVDESGEATSGLGIRNYLSNTFMGDFYLTKIPGLIGLICGLLALIVTVIGLFREEPPAFCGWIFGGAMSLISVLEIVGFFCAGSDAYWWVNPDDVGYVIATVMLIPFSITATLQIIAFKLYKLFPIKEAGPNAIFKILMGIGCVIAVIASIQVIMNFIFAAFCLGLLLWLGGQKTYSKDSSGNVYVTSIYGTRKLDK